MKKIAFLTVAVVLMGVVMAQRPSLRHNPEPLEFHADGNVHFTVFVNEVIQNHRPAQCVQVTAPIDDNTTILVEVQENDRLAGRYLHLREVDAHGLYYVVFQNNLVDVYTSKQYDDFRRHRNMHGSYGNDNCYSDLHDQYGHGSGHNSHSNDSHNSHNHDVHHNPGGHRAVSGHEYSHIVTQIASETFDDSRLKLARSIFATHYFSAAQIKLLAEKFTFSKNRMEFAMMAYDHCVDKADYFVVVDAFLFKSDKDKLNKFIQQQR